jgi:hypothetical protein
VMLLYCEVLLESESGFVNIETRETNILGNDINVDEQSRIG